MQVFSRNNFLKLLSNTLSVLGGLLVLRGLARFFSFQIEPDPQTVFDLGDASHLPPGSGLLRADIPAMVYNNAGVFSAHSLVCTHLGCTVEPVGENGFTCPCHGSRFSQEGVATQGPATSALRRLRVEVDEEGKLWLYTK